MPHFPCRDKSASCLAFCRCNSAVAAKGTQSVAAAPTHEKSVPSGNMQSHSGWPPPSSPLFAPPAPSLSPSPPPSLAPLHSATDLPLLSLSRPTASLIPSLSGAQQRDTNSKCSSRSARPITGMRAMLRLRTKRMGPRSPPWRAWEEHVDGKEDWLE